MPNVAGLSLEEAQQLLDSIGFATHLTFRTGQSAPMGTVVEQRPEAGTILLVGAEVRLYISAKLEVLGATPGLVVGANATLPISVNLEAGVPYYFYTQDHFNITDNVTWGPVFNCCGRMYVAGGPSNAGLSVLIFVPETSGSYSVVINNNNPVQFSFTFVIARYIIAP
ncbi:MAG: PASTA domain-containing protein [Chloroflexota bacterium]